VESILEIIKNNQGFIVTLVTVSSIFIEISPIKINPISALFKWIGDALNKDTREQLSSISTKLESVSDRIDKIEINDMRSTILDFANSCMNERKHTKEEFEHIIDLHTQYEDTISKKNMKNGRVELAFKYISDLYTSCLNENSFLND